jgi:putative ABC transport system substrate-binding protein
MKRRNFIVLVGSAAVVWSVAASAQQSERMRRIGFLTGLAESDPAMMRNMREFRLALQKLGWVDGQNLQLTIRYAAGDLDQARILAKNWLDCNRI